MKNRLKFNVLVDTEREFLTLQLEGILKPKKIEATDPKIKNFPILATGEMNKKIIDQVIIKAFQDFEQYMKINPNIEISDSDIQTKLRFYSKRYKDRFIANSLLFSSAIIGNTNAIFIIRMD